MTMSSGATPRRPRPERRRAAWLGGGLAGTFCLLAGLVAGGAAQGLDEAVIAAVPPWQLPLLDRWLPLLTDIGHELGVIPLALLLVLHAGWRRDWPQALYVALAMGGAGLCNRLCKLGMARPRPDLWPSLAVETSWSFPSGHATGAAALATVLAVLAWPGRWRWPVLGGGVLFALLVGLSRLYLGVHWPSDVLAGWLLGAGAALLAWACAGSVKKGRDLCRSADIS